MFLFTTSTLFIANLKTLNRCACLFWKKNTFLAVKEWYIYNTYTLYIDVLEKSRVLRRRDCVLRSCCAENNAMYLNIGLMITVVFCVFPIAQSKCCTRLKTRRNSKHCSKNKTAYLNLNSTLSLNYICVLKIHTVWNQKRFRIKFVWGWLEVQFLSLGTHTFTNF